MFFERRLIFNSQPIKPRLQFGRELKPRKIGRIRKLSSFSLGELRNDLLGEESSGLSAALNLMAVTRARIAAKLSTREIAGADTETLHRVACVIEGGMTAEAISRLRDFFCSTTRTLSGDALSDSLQVRRAALERDGHEVPRGQGAVQAVIESITRDAIRAIDTDTETEEEVESRQGSVRGKVVTFLDVINLMGQARTLERYDGIDKRATAFAKLSFLRATKADSRGSSQESARPLAKVVEHTMKTKALLADIGPEHFSDLIKTASENAIANYKSRMEKGVFMQKRDKCFPEKLVFISWLERLLGRQSDEGADGIKQAFLKAFVDMATGESNPELPRPDMKKYPVQAISAVIAAMRVPQKKEDSRIIWIAEQAADYFINQITLARSDGAINQDFGEAVCRQIYIVFAEVLHGIALHIEKVRLTGDSSMRIRSVVPRDPLGALGNGNDDDIGTGPTLTSRLAVLTKRLKS